MGLPLEEHATWLCQGDVFESVPLWQPALTGDGDFTYRRQQGPAVLMSHDCALDKRNGAGELQVERITFLPIQTLSNLNPSVQALLRSTPDSLPPYESLFLGTLSTWGECFIAMSTPTRVPARIFDLQSVQADPLNPKDLRATPWSGDTRIGRLANDRLDLLRSKWITYWTGRKPTPRGQSGN